MRKKARTPVNLEVLLAEPRSAPKPTPLVFVHGAFAGAWVWESHFLPFFAAHGYRALALSLRGHGGSDGRERLHTARLKDYVADVRSVAERLGQPPILIGHSMGGMVVQHYLHRHGAAGAVLMASAPPHGLLPSYLTMMLTRPHLLFNLWLVQTLGPGFADLDLLRRALFSEDTPEEAFWRFVPRLAAESALAILDLYGLDLPPSGRIRGPAAGVPVLVLGAGNDVFIDPGAVAETARVYGTQPEIFPGMAHALMLDHAWEAVARRILGWLETTVTVDAMPSAA